MLTETRDVRPRHRYSAPRGGHAPGHLRDALLEALEDRSAADWWEALSTPDGLSFHDDRQQRRWDALSAPERGRWLVGQLWNCTDVLPSGVSGKLGVDDEVGRRIGSYAQLVRHLADTLP